MSSASRSEQHVITIEKSINGVIVFHLLTRIASSAKGAKVEMHCSITAVAFWSRCLCSVSILFIQLSTYGRQPTSASLR